ncbi:MAG TPA: diguanylate cyclase [Nitrospirota bacterium]|nr:diguanylate cyclase [Nitrospirota bacterium]
MTFSIFKEHKTFIAVLMTIVIFMVDVLTPLWYEVWVLYLIPLVFIYQTSKRPYGYSVIVTLLVFTGMFFPAPDSSQLVHAAVNRFTGILGGWGVSVLLMKLRGLQQAQIQASDKLQKSVEERTFELSQANSSLRKKNDDLSLAEKALRESEARFRALIENSPVAIRISVVGVTVYANRKYCEMFGFQNSEELRGRPVIEQWAPQDRDRVADRALQRGLGSEVPIEYEGTGQRKDGSQFPLHVAVGLVHLAEGPASVAFLTDITERRKATEELKRLNELLLCQASTDPLTGISNRSKFSEALSIEIMRSRRFRLPLSLIIFDVDHFKIINDTYGHNAGDSALQYLTGLVEKFVRRHDVFARWGGEEFVIMVTNTGERGATIFAEKLRSMIEKFDFPEVGHLTCSFGVAEFVHDDTDEVLINRADQTLYRAKAAGRNRVESKMVLHAVD